MIRFFTNKLSLIKSSKLSLKSWGHSIEILPVAGNISRINSKLKDPFSGLRFEVPKDKEKLESNFKVYNIHTEEYDETLKSSILDVFDFDTSVINNEIKKVDCYVEVTNPLDEYSFLKERVKDFIII